jgi:hypothetical protein
VRFLILSTPKTGSTWLRHLLSCIYRVPQLDLDYPFNRATASLMGPAWVSHHHFLPAPHLLEWVQQERVRVITMTRHPGDVLISLYHHLRGFKAATIDQRAIRSMLHSDFDRAAILPAKPAAPFSWELSCSIEWMARSDALVVRYEDLWRDPSEALTRLTSQLSAVEPDRIDMAIEQCSLALLRSLAGSHGGFFRAGRVGDWRHDLAPETVRDFATTAPYPAQLAKLGYTLDPADPLIAAPQRPRPDANPFRAVPRFDNDVPVPPVAVHAFLAQPADVRARWSPVDRTGPGSFFAWLNDSSVDGIQDPEWNLPLTNLALHVHRQRFDLISAFDLSNIGRPMLAAWCLQYLESEYGADGVFRAPLIQALTTWGNQPSPEDRSAQLALPLTNYAMFVYRTHPGLPEAFPDVVRTHRLSFLHWVVRNAGELAAPPACIEAIRRLLMATGTAICAVRTPLPPRRPPTRWRRLPQFATRLYKSQRDLQTGFPDAHDTHQLSYLHWIIDHAPAMHMAPDRLDEARAFLWARLVQISEEEQKKEREHGEPGTNT